MQEERRGEHRVPFDLTVLVWGLDAEGEPFRQEAIARNISTGGALLAGLRQPLRSGDFIYVQYGQVRARFHVVWSRECDYGMDVVAAVQRLAGNPCPWQEVLLSEQQPT